MPVKVKTKPFGEIEIQDKQIVEFPEGILGFEYIKKFIIMDSSEKSPFKWLQAFDEPDLAFVIIRPADFMIEYELVVAQGDLEAVGCASADDLLVFAIVTIPDNPSDMTANLQGPIIINPVTHIGRQAISLSDRYRVRHRILDEVKRATEGRG